MPRIGDYELLETIANGAFGKVKLAKHIPTGQMYAAKIIPKTNKDVERDIRVEISIMRRLNHENVMHLNEILESQNNYYIMLEPAMGGDLCDLVMKHPKGLDEPQCARVFLQILQGLKACHSNRVAHRDLKPENILFTEAGMVKISDFGLSRLHRTSVNEASAAEFAKTLTGTLQYVSPEVLRGPYDAFKADLWSLGCILYVMLTSRFPFGSAKDRELERRIKEGTFERLPPTVSAEAADLVAKLMKVNPNDRLPLDRIPEHPFLFSFAPLNGSFRRKYATAVELMQLNDDDFHTVDDRDTSPVAGLGSSASSPKVPQTRFGQPQPVQTRPRGSSSMGGSFTTCGVGGMGGIGQAMGGVNGAGVGLPRLPNVGGSSPPDPRAGSPKLSATGSPLHGAGPAPATQLGTATAAPRPRKLPSLAV